MLVKCKWCEKKSKKETMKVESKETTRKKKDGTYAITNTYYHPLCYEEVLKDKEFKKQELVDLDELYTHLLEVHDLKALDGRMMEKIQDLRNGTVKYNGKKVKRYKEGIPFAIMLESYKGQQSQINYAMRSMRFEKKWNEFSYCFGIMSSKVNDALINQRAVKRNEEKHKEQMSVRKKEALSEEIVVKKTNERAKKKKDELDISDFL
ncbi:hypothetical protein ACI2JA_03560 [Alkalihalobacillus sp. NPDC078783]